MRLTLLSLLSLLSLLAVLTLSSTAFADEGMWTFDDFPSKKVAEKYGFEPSQEWLDHVRLASVRLAGGCSGSVVSPDGLVMTNHHCAHACIEQLSSGETDYVADGFYAETAADERRCPEIELNQLVEIRDVTERIVKATKGLEGEAYITTRKAEMSRIEKECATDKSTRCDVVTLYHGGRYALYRYQRYQDVRLVFAPELAVAFFGGDPDNFTFPRFNLDAAFLRIYEDGKPAKTEHYFPWSPAGAPEGALTFVSGHPGGTSRLLTVAELETLRDMQLPERLFFLAELRGMLREFTNRGAEQKRVATKLLFYVENGFKALRGRLAALQDSARMEMMGKAERDFRAAAAAAGAMKTQSEDPWDAIAAAQATKRELYWRYSLLEWRRGFMSDMFRHAVTLVRAAAEADVPDAKRLREYTEARRPALEQGLFSAAPVYPEFEEATLAFGLRKLREELGAGDEFVREVFGKKSPEELAAEVVRGTKLMDPAARRALYEGGQAAIDASDDPMIRLARVVDPAARAVRKRVEDEVESVVGRSSEQIAAARFQLYGTERYPDATFTLRLSYGAVEGYEEFGKRVNPITQMRGLFERATGREPFALPPRWVAARDRLDLDTPMNIATTNDIIGGNSGSPMVDREGRIVGLIFDGNIQSLGGDYWFDASVNRAVAVHSEALIHALERVYGADRLVKELRP